MLEVASDLIAEAEALHDFLGALRPEDWQRPTAFQGWTPWDVVAHLHYYDRVSLAALGDPDVFAERRKALVEALVAGKSNAELAREEFGELSADGLRAQWIATCREMARQLGESDPGRRLPWFGPDMGVRMFTTARLMETWAHGQEIYDLMNAERTPTDRLRHIATIGVKTYGWTFANRGLAPPGPPPYVRLQAPSGAIWEWNEPSETDFVRGDALAFSQVVTQTRNVADTKLEVGGEVARRWMEIAQCFAGPAVDPPKPATRIPEETP